MNKLFAVLDISVKYTKEMNCMSGTHMMTVIHFQFGQDSVLNRDLSLRRAIVTSPLHQNNASWNRQESWVPKPGTPPQRPWCQGQKIPPEVPKRTSSISSRSTETRSLRVNGLNKTRENGSLSSVQSSGSDSSLSADRVTCENLEDNNHRCSPIWKRKGQVSEDSRVLVRVMILRVDHTLNYFFFLFPSLYDGQSKKVSM